MCTGKAVEFFKSYTKIDYFAPFGNLNRVGTNTLAVPTELAKKLHNLTQNVLFSVPLFHLIV